MVDLKLYLYYVVGVSNTFPHKTYQGFTISGHAITAFMSFRVCLTANSTELGNPVAGLISVSKALGQHIIRCFTSWHYDTIHTRC